MVQLRLPDRVIHLDPEDSVLDSDGAGVLGDRRSHGLFPAGDGLGFPHALGKLRKTRLQLPEDIGQVIEAHGGLLTTSDAIAQTGCGWYDKPMRGFRFFLALLLGVPSLMGCGYNLQTSSSAWLEREGIRKIYVTPLVNNTYKSGVENLVYNALLRAMLSNRRLALVHDPEQADAVLGGAVVRAQFGPSASATGDQLNPIGTGSAYNKISVATEYVAELSCSFSLTRRNVAPGGTAILWTAGFTRAKPFSASNQLSSLGTTSALINESEFDRSLQELAQSMMADVRESMVARF